MKILVGAILAATAVSTVEVQAQTVIPAGNTEHVITYAGSYVLGGNRVFPMGGNVTSMIRVEASNVEIDLAGFSLGANAESNGRVTCSSNFPVTCSRITSASLAHGIYVAPGAKNVRIKNGVINGTWGPGILCRDECVIENVRISHANGIGIQAGSSSRISSVSVDNVAGHGVQVSSQSVLDSVRVNWIGGMGISTGLQSNSTNLSVSNAVGSGIYLSGGSLAGCQVYQSALSGEQNFSEFGVHATHGAQIDGCSITNNGIGVGLDSGSAIRNSAVFGSKSFGLYSDDPHSTFSGMTFSRNNEKTTGPQVSGGVALGPSVCNGVSC